MAGNATHRDRPRTMASAPCRAFHLLLPVLLGCLLHRAAAQPPTTAPDKKQLLLQIKRAWGDPSVLAAWNGKGDHCTWPYVACDASSGLVANLSLANTNVAGPVSDAIDGLSGLTILDLYNNSINGTFPTSVYRCTSLRYLDLSENYLGGDLPADIGTGLGKERHARTRGFTQVHGPREELVLESRRKLYENLLWEHQELTNAHKALHVKYQKSQAEAKDLPQVRELLDRVTALQGGKETISAQQHTELQMEKEEAARLREELAELKRQHALKVQQVVDSSQAEITKARKEIEDQRSQEFFEMEQRLHKELKVVEDLRDLEKKRNDALEATKLSWAEIVDRLDRQVEVAFPHSQGPTIDAGLEAWKDEVAPRVELWNTADHLTALASRVSHMVKLGRDLLDAAIHTLKSLWPGETVPNRIEAISAQLNESDMRLDEWRHSSARSRADMALKFVCSWYETFDLDALETLRDGAPTLVDPALQEKRQHRAYTIAQYAPVETFIPDPFPDVEDEEESPADEGDEEDGSEEDVDGDIEADEPSSQDLASKASAPESSSAENPDAGAA